MTIQLTIIKIDEYGPWTLTLGSDRESQLQMLQAKTYHDLQKAFSEKNCLVFFNRFDEYFVITNTLSIGGHISIIKEISKQTELSLSFTIGRGNTPLDANMQAYQARKERKYLDTDTTFPIYGCSSCFLEPDPIQAVENDVKILHIDLEGSSNLTSKLSPYEVTFNVMNIYTMLMNAFLKKNSLTFFLGGDNFMTVTSLRYKYQISELLNNVSSKLGITLNCGIGIGKNSRDAAKNATHALDSIRKLRDEGKIIHIYEIQ